LIRNPGVGGQNIVIHKEVLFGIGGFDVRLTTSEDRSLMIELLKSTFSNKIHIVESMIVIIDKLERDRLTNSNHRVLGLKYFYMKYSNMMTFKQKLINYNKLKYEEFKYFKGILRIVKLSEFLMSKLLMLTYKRLKKNE
jgi:hypothetical protein